MSIHFSSVYLQSLFLRDYSQFPFLASSSDWASRAPFFCKHQWKLEGMDLRLFRTPRVCLSLSFYPSEKEPNPKVFLSFLPSTHTVRATNEAVSPVTTTWWFSVIACQLCGALLNDRIPLRLARRSGIWHPEYRLTNIFVVMFASPIGIGIYGAGLQYVTPSPPFSPPKQARSRSLSLSLSFS